MSKELIGGDLKISTAEKIESVDKVAQRRAELALSAELGLGRVDALSPAEQAEFYKERVIQMRQAILQALPIVQEHDQEKAGYDEYNLSDDLAALSDLTASAYRSLQFPSRTLSENNLPEGLSPQAQWDACLDLVLHLNRGYGVTTNEMVKVKGAVDDLYNYGKVAHDPIRKPYKLPKTFFYRVMARLFGQERLSKFVNENCDVNSYRWLRKDVLGD